MAKLLQRIKTTITADIHNLLDQKEQKNPIAMLNEYLRQCEKETEKVKQYIQRQYLLKNEFTKELQYAEELVQKRKHQAEIALKAEEEELYKAAVNEQNYYEERSGRLKKSLQITKSQLEDLEQKYEEMKHKLKQMQLKKYELMGRENAAKANLEASKLLNDGNLDGPYSRFQEIENYLESIENQVNKNYYRNILDTRIPQLEKEMKQEPLA